MAERGAHRYEMPLFAIFIDYAGTIMTEGDLYFATNNRCIGADS